MKLTLFEQSAFLLDDEASTYIFDPGSYATASIPTMLKDGKPAGVFVSHIHPDHFDKTNLETIGSPVYGPPEVIEALGEAALETYVIESGQPIALDDITVTAFDVDHGPNAGNYKQNYGYVIEIEDKRILFLGDIGADSPIPEDSYDLVLVPVGGFYTFDHTEAFNFLQRLKCKGKIIPIHYSDKNSHLNPAGGQEFVTLAETYMHPVLLESGESVTL